MMDVETKRRISRQLLRTLKLCKRGTYVLRRAVSEHDKSILFILGCQRSGTTLATRIFEADWNAKIFGEFSKLSAQGGIRLKPLPEVKELLCSEKYPFLVVKPLVESHRARELLECFPNSRALWLYRHFVDVAASDLAMFGTQNGIENLRPIVNKEPDNWRQEGMCSRMYSVVAQHFSEDMDPMDAASLFWYSRNQLFFQDNLESSDRVMLLPYEQLVASPAKTMREIYEFAGRPFPGRRIVSEVDRRSVGKGRSKRVSTDIRELCDSLLVKLDQMAGYGRASI